VTDRKWHFGKHEKSLSGLLGAQSYFGMAKCQFRLSLKLVTETAAQPAQRLAEEEPATGDSVQRHSQLAGFFPVVAAHYS